MGIIRGFRQGRDPIVWKTQDGGQTYRDWQTEKLRQAGVKITKG
jgi:hypothetical protein